MSQRWIARLASEPASGKMPQVRLHAAILAASETEARPAAISHLQKTELGARPEDHPQIAGILATGRHPLGKARDILRLAKDVTKGQAA